MTDETPQRRTAQGCRRQPLLHPHVRVVEVRGAARDGRRQRNGREHGPALGRVLDRPFERRSRDRGDHRARRLTARERFANDIGRRRAEATPRRDAPHGRAGGHARAAPAGPPRDRRHAGGGDHRPRRHRHPGRDGLPPERPLALGLPGKGRRPPRGQGVGDHGGRRVLARGERAPAAPARHVSRAAGGRAGRGRRALAPAVAVEIPSRPLDPVDRGHGRAHRRARLGALRVRAPRLPRSGPSGVEVLPGDRDRPRRRQPPARGRESRALRGRGARRARALG